MTLLEYLDDSKHKLFGYKLLVIGFRSTNYSRKSINYLILNCAFVLVKIVYDLKV